MQSAILGRTNEAFPRIWLSLSVPHEGFGEAGVAGLAHAARETGLPLDIGSQPALWGGPLRGGEDVLLTFGGRHLEVAHDEGNAFDLTQSHLIETLSAVGRETIDFYMLTIRRPLEEFAINGGLGALEDARQEGHIRHFGIHAEGQGMAALGMWQFHDFCETLAVARNPVEHEAYDSLVSLADERRVGVVTLRPLEWRWSVPAPLIAAHLGLASETEATAALLAYAASRHTTLVAVRNPQEVQAAADVPAEVPREAPAYLARLEAAYRDIALWRELTLDRRPWLARAAEKAVRDLGG